MTKVWKRNGKIQAFSKTKVLKSCRKCGASVQQSTHVAENVALKVKTRRVVKAQKLSRIIISSLRSTNKRAAVSFAKFKKSKYA